MVRRAGAAAVVLLLVRPHALEAVAACTSELPSCSSTTQEEGLALLQLSAELQQGGVLEDAADAVDRNLGSRPAATGGGRKKKRGDVDMVRQVKEPRPDEWTLAHHLEQEGITTAEEACDAVDANDDDVITAAEWNTFTNDQGMRGEKGDGLGPMPGADWDLATCESILGAMVKMPETDKQESEGRPDNLTPEQMFAQALVKNGLKCAPLLTAVIDINPKDGQVEPHEWMHFCQGYGIEDDAAMVIFKGFFSTTQTTAKAAEVFVNLGLPATFC